MIGRIVRYVRAHHVAFLALFLILGGGSAYAAATLVPKNSVGSAQVRNGSLQTKDLSKRARKALKGNRGPRGPAGAAGAAGARGATGPTGAQGIQGIAGTPGTPGTARAYAFMATPGASPAFEAQWTKNFTAVAHNSTGVYCLTPGAGINVDASPAVVTVDWGASASGQRDFAEVRTRHLTCGAGQYEVHTFQSALSSGNMQDPAASDAVAFTIIVP
jgi:hypothetical protein